MHEKGPTRTRRPFFDPTPFADQTDAVPPIPGLAEFAARRWFEFQRW